MMNKFRYSRDSGEYEDEFINMLCFIMIGWYNEEVIMD
jgi:hypothetical protein